ncbi:cobalt ABC transporter, ATPase subunit [Candidatus Moduliflexus flocculans]|uniref:Cobalt ABC transporter, ATPase subunit n=1 Tax=Candidatus Moduliflexus flocculans TaxID=1499966 RepID=A0A081BLY6_9BACT|nr:cobalt ABC transporter, ATPase subunit [Candidatus Moduliflexus flocculans]
MSHHRIEMTQVRHAYPDGTLALQGVSFCITHGESVALIGGNGAGKSTLLLHLNGYLMPTQGEVRVGDIPVTRQTLATIRRAVGMVFQDPDDQLFMPTVYDDVAFGPLNLGLPLEEVDRRVIAALEQVGLTHVKDKPPYRLSEGQKRSIAIATVLSMQPNILVMDEPTSNLDPRARRNLINLLKTFTHTKIIATHDLDMVLDVCERTIILHEGRIAADGVTREILQDEPLLEATHLEKPARLAVLKNNRDICK